MSTGTLAALAPVVDGRLAGVDARFDGVSTDSRTVGAGELFVALSGPNFDGHAFVAAAAARGAAAALVARELPDCTLPQLVVADTRAALGAYARAWRLQADVDVLGVTGSNGKTTVKEMAAAILGERTATLVTRGNLNNDIGLPLTLLGLGRQHRAAVIEMGANHAGEIAYLASVAVPRVGIVTNAGSAHLEGFGSVEGVARAKGELFAALPAHGHAVINANDAHAPLWRETAAHCRRVEFGIDVEADFRVETAEVRSDGAVQSFPLHAPDRSLEFSLPALGRHNLQNALAAVAATVAMGATLDEARVALARFVGVGGRQRWFDAHRGARLLDDSYNANPDSLDAALQVLASVPGRRWLALGDMLELGTDAEAIHARAGERARALGVERLFAVGPLSAAAVRAFGPDAEHFDDAAELAARIDAELEPGVTVLVKGSRGMRMERVVAALQDGGGD